MKNRKYWAALLAVLVVSAQGTVAFASDDVDDTRILPGSTLYAYDDDLGYLVPVYDTDGAFKPGDTIYIPVVTQINGSGDWVPATKSEHVKSYKVYTDWILGKSYVEDVSIVYKKADREIPDQVTYQTTISGLTGNFSSLNTTYTSSASYAGTLNEFLTQLNAKIASEKASITSSTSPTGKYTYNRVSYDTEAEAREAAIRADSYITHNAGSGAVEESWTFNGASYTAETAARAAAVNGKTAENLRAVHTAAADEYWTVDGQTYTTEADAKAALVTATSFLTNSTLGISGSDSSWSWTGNAGATYATEQEARTAALASFDISGFHTDAVTESWTYNGGTFTSDADAVAYIRDNASLDDLSIIHTSAQDAVDETWSYNGQPYTSEELAIAAAVADTSGLTSAALGVTAENETLYFYNGTAYASQALAEAAVDAAARYTATDTSSVDTSRGYSYFVAVETSQSTTTKEWDLAGEIDVAKTSSKAKNQEGYDLEVTLTNGVYEGDRDDITIDSPDTNAVVDFDDDASDVTITWGDDLAYFEVDVRGQSDLNLAYNTKYNADFSERYPEANIDFLTFVAAPSFNRTGTLYIYADEDSYIYEVTEDGAKKINSATYDEDEGAWVIRTRKLSSYAISDRKLTTVDQMVADDEDVPVNEDGDTASDGTSTGADTEDGTKYNPDTGR